MTFRIFSSTTSTVLIKDQTFWVKFTTFQEKSLNPDSMYLIEFRLPRLIEFHLPHLIGLRLQHLMEFRVLHLSFRKSELNRFCRMLDPIKTEDHCRIWLKLDRNFFSLVIHFFLFLF
jgi:hypothetical protein